MVPIYDDFGAGQLDERLWRAIRSETAGFAAGSALRLDCQRGACRLDLRGGRGGEAPATVLAATRTWEVGRDALSFSTTVEAAAAGAEDACAAFGVFDPAGGTVIGIAATGSRLIAIARDSGLGLLPTADGALEYTDLPVRTEPQRRHDLKVEYDPARHIARWYIDEVMQLYREVPFDPRELTCGFGLLALRPAAQVQISATWGPIQYEDEGELDPDPFFAAQPG